MVRSSTKSAKPQSEDAMRLKKIIKRMKRIQREIAGIEEPPSMLQIDELQRLGKKYAQLVERMQSDALT